MIHIQKEGAKRREIFSQNKSKASVNPLRCLTVNKELRNKKNAADRT